MSPWSARIRFFIASLKLDEAIAKIETARAEGLRITADAYPYTAGSTGLNAAIPPWVQEGGFDASVARMKDPATRKRIAREMLEKSDEWENMYLGASSPKIIRQKLALPWVSFCSDSPSLAAEGVFLKSSTHPRAYGSFARLLGKYVREEKVMPLEEAIRKLSALPCQNLKIDRRGMLKAGYHADVVVFDPAQIQDHATFAKPHQYATGMVHVFVNGAHVL